MPKLVCRRCCLPPTEGPSVGPSTFTLSTGAVLHLSPHLPSRGFYHSHLLSRTKAVDFSLLYLSIPHAPPRLGGVSKMHVPPSQSPVWKPSLTPCCLWDWPHLQSPGSQALGRQAPLPPHSRCLAPRSHQQVLRRPCVSPPLKPFPLPPVPLPPSSADPVHHSVLLSDVTSSTLPPLLPETRIKTPSSVFPKPTAHTCVNIFSQLAPS